MAKPSPLLLALESRAIAEFGAFMGVARAMRAFIPAGEGQPVLVLPGFMAGDSSTRPMRSFLRKLGYPTHGWGLGTNIGPTDRILDGVTARVDELVERHQQPISLVGWSLGGVYSREIARVAPELVRDVITLGSPFQMREADSTNAAPIHNFLQSRYSESIELPRVPDHKKEALSIPTTAIFTRSDGIVHWDHCIDVPGDQHENVEVFGSHCGLGHNPAALLVIGSRLAQSPTNWHRFRPPRALRHLFRDADHVSAAHIQAA